MNKTKFYKIVETRPDFSEYLWHFTKGKDAELLFHHILYDGIIKDMDNDGCICFTEAPLSILPEMFEYFNTYNKPFFAPWGFGFKKDFLFSKGARPVIYTKKVEMDYFIPKLQWRLEEYEPNVRDFTWMREWRLHKKTLDIDAESCILFVPTEMDRDMLVEVEFDEGDQTGLSAVFTRSYKCESMEWIKEKRPTCSELREHIDSQIIGEEIDC